MLPRSLPSPSIVLSTRHDGRGRALAVPQPPRGTSHGGGGGEGLGGAAVGRAAGRAPQAGPRRRPHGGRPGVQPLALGGAERAGAVAPSRGALPRRPPISRRGALPRQTPLLRRPLWAGARRRQARRGAGAVDNSVLSLLVDAAPSLKSLRIISGDRIVDERLSLTVTSFPLLEELELSLCTDVYPGTCEAVGTACPLLKRFRLSKKQFCKWNTKNIVQEAMAIATMGGLRSLQLFANPLSDDGLAAILDGCPRLESLDIRHCFNVGMGAAAIRARCPGIETLRLPDDSTIDYDLKFSPPDMTTWNTQDEHHCDWHELVYFSSW